MAKINIQKYEGWLNFLQDVLYPKQDQLNALFLEAGEEGLYHNFFFRLKELREEFPTSELDAAHQVVLAIDPSATVALYERIRTLYFDLNNQLVEAAKMGLQLDLAQHVRWIDGAPEDEEDIASARYALILDVSAPNIVTEDI